MKLLLTLLAICFLSQQAFAAGSDTAFERKIPVRDSAPTALDYHDQPIDKSHRLHDEGLLDIQLVPIAGENFYAREDKLNAPYYKKICSGAHVYVRRTVAGKLLQANQLLRPYGVELFVLDGYRHINCQRALWDYFLGEAKAVLKTNDMSKIRNYAGRYCSDPSSFDPQNSKTWPTHTTGGAVDLTLRRLDNGEQLFMGAIFDDPSDKSHSDYFERIPEQKLSVSDLDARRNRRLLHWVMDEVGFTNYPYEWWHFDYGTQMWAQNSGAGHTAFYGLSYIPSKQIRPKTYKARPRAL